MSLGDVPTWITAIATVMLFGGAAAAAVYAKRTYDQGKAQFQLQQAKPSLIEVFALANSIGGRAEDLRDPRRKKSAQWSEVGHLSENEARFKGAELRIAGYPQFEEMLKDLAEYVNLFDGLRKFRNEKAHALTMSRGDVNSGLRLNEDDNDQFEQAHREARAKLKLIADKCEMLERTVLEVFDNLRE